jgi:hypothetical protein
VEVLSDLPIPLALNVSRGVWSTSRHLQVSSDAGGADLEMLS